MLLAKTFASAAQAMASENQSREYGPWNPGIESTLPSAFLPLSTVFRSENVSSTLDEVRELSDFSGMAIELLSTFRAERLTLHEVLIRVMADLTVPDGERYEDLGINFRQMTAVMLEKHISPHMPEIHRAFEQLKRDASAFIDKAQTPAPSSVHSLAGRADAGWHWSKLLRPGRMKPHTKLSAEPPEAQDLRAIAGWRTKAQAIDLPFERACFQALVKTADAIFNRHGRLFGDRSLITSLATRLVCNDYGSLMIGQLIDPHFGEAVLREGYQWLPAQEHPIVMNVKGASASGKSTMRPLQKALASRLGIQWAEFALISPDIWRKFLLDYASLGPAQRYAGTLTGHEIRIIDEKLDLYMSRKAKAGRMSHLLIDRFRFDSFAQEPDEEDGSRLLTRFGDQIYMFFMITPPEATVERAWKRGEEFGRYKAVDDLLAHNVEAYTGIPDLFFTWTLRDDKRVYFEFLDNSVTEGQRPRTVAFGLNGRMNILDIKCLFDVDRYRSINIEARSPEAVYAAPSSMTTASNGEFLKQCVRRIPSIDFVHYRTGQIYARVESGKLIWWNRDIFEQAVPSPDVRAAFEAIVIPLRGASLGSCGFPDRLDHREMVTLGQWGGERW